MFVCGGEMRPTFVYRFFDSEDKLLYVGISYHLENRLDSHRFGKPWDRISRIQIERFPTREEAAAAEREAILSEAPEWNVIYVPLFPIESSRKRPRQTYLAKAKSWWPNAEWVIGRGRWATLAYCRVLTIQLHDTEEQAEKALNWIGRIGCGGVCHRDHHLVDLDRSKPAHLPNPFEDAI